MKNRKIYSFIHHNNAKVRRARKIRKTSDKLMQYSNEKDANVANPYREETKLSKSK